MTKFQESKFRTWLAQQPATKLFIKSLIDLIKLDIIQLRISVLGLVKTVKCNVSRVKKNGNSVECNLCEWTGNSFYPHVTTAGVMENEKCPNCHSIPRYRTLIKFLKDYTKIYNSKFKILEVGPNRSLQNIFLANPNLDYTSIDLKSPHAMIHMDVTDLKFDSEQFDILFCIGVMQYVEDDLKGFNEMYRVLKPKGQLIFASGINEKVEKTIEYDKKIASNNFTIRTYGWDLKEKIKKAGFKIQLFNPYKEATEVERQKFGLGIHTIFLLEK